MEMVYGVGKTKIEWGVEGRGGKGRGRLGRLDEE